MKVRIYIFVVNPPLQGIFHVLDSVAEIFLDLTRTGTGGDRKVTK
jgi:hypothetical protein